VRINAIQIALVDDDRSILQLLVRLLEKLGYTRVTAFTSGQQALEHLHQSGADLLFLDINMPRLDGVQFIRQLASMEYRGAIVIVSGEGERLIDGVDRLLRSHQLESLGWIRKPFTRQEVQGVLEKFRPPRRKPRRRTSSRQYAAQDLERALAQHELVNHYQPIVSLKSRAAIGVETLVRWQHPTDGLVYPDQFLGEATKYGLLTALTRGVLQRAVEDAKRWAAAGHALHVSVNVTMDDIASLHFPDEVEACVLAHGIAPADVTLEVTESQAMQALSTSLDVLSRLRLKRFRISMDDFGTGYSSLAQLRYLPFDEIKLERGFVHGAAGDERRRAICCAGLQMAKQLRLATVAEGVEDLADWNFVQTQGCDLAQGYFITRPMPAPDVAAWLETWRSRSASGSAPPPLGAEP